MRVGKLIGLATAMAVLATASHAQASTVVARPDVVAVSAGVIDTVGDEAPKKLGSGDLTSVRVATKNVAGVPSLFASAVVSSWVALTSTAWTKNDTYLDWYVDINGDGTKDYDVYLYNDLNAVHVDVVRISSGATVCRGVPSSNSTARSYGARAPLSCFGNPRSLRVYANIRYSLGGVNYATDTAPNRGWTAPLNTQAWPNRPGTPTATSARRALDVKWTPPAASLWPVTDYLVQYSLATPIAWKTFADGVSTVPSTRITNLVAGKQYVVRVIARNKLGYGVSSASSVARTPLP